MSATLLDDPLLRAVATVGGYKILPPCLLTQKLGGGGMGMVYRGFHTKLEIDVAVKVLSPLVASQDPRFVDRFQREARLAARIAPENPNLIHVYDVAEASGLHYIVMEFVHGETVRERVQRKGRLAEREAIAILAGAANGLASAHARDVVHRDVKPDNLMVTRDGRVKVADLGLAKATDLGSDQSLSVVMGTPKYMAPEHWLGMEHVRAPADVWALGATLFFMLAGADPFAGPSQGQPFPDVDAQLPQVSSECRALLLRCVAADPSDRFADARALADAIAKQWPDRAARLADAEAGQGSIRATTVTPPPAKTVALARQTTLDPADARTLAPRRQAAATGSASSPAPARRRLGLLAGGAVLAVAALVWLSMSLARGSGSEALLRGKRQIRQPDTLDAGILSLEEARRLESDNPEVVRTLVQAYLARARLQMDSDLARALADLVAAAQLDNSADIKQMRADAVARVAERLTAKVTVAAPVAGAVSGRQVAVDVDCNDALVEVVRVQGAEVAKIAGRARTTVAFDRDGPQEIEVVALGPQGTSVERRVPVLVDTTPPIIEIDSPLPQSPVGRTVTVAGSVRDTTAVRLSARVAAGDATPIVVAGDGGFRADLRVADATPDGQELSIALTAVDGAGLSSERSVRVRVDKGLPVLTLGDIPRRTRLPQVEVRVRAEDSTRVEIGGAAASRSGEFWVAQVALVEGANQIEVVATGRNGNVQRLPLVIERDATPPLFTVLTPPRANAGGDVTIAGRVSEVAVLTVDGNPVSLGEDLRFVATLSLPVARRAAIVVRARDDVDNETVVEIPVDAEVVTPARVLAADWEHAVVDATPGPVSRYPLRVRDQASGIVLRLIEPGEFVMGSDSSVLRDEGAHRVRITRPFYVAETETTLAQWRRVNGSPNSRVGRAVGDDHPVSYVSWDDVRTWLQRLNGAPLGAFRLPTEAEWEYACRAGTATAFSCGDELDKAVANFASEGTKVVASLRANAWGLFDMHGNVAEWCEDVYDKDYYATSPVEDPPGPSTAGDRVVRGGSYFSDASFCRAASRQARRRDKGDRSVGFRVVRTLPP